MILAAIIGMAWGAGAVTGAGAGMGGSALAATCPPAPDPVAATSSGPPYAVSRSNGELLFVSGQIGVDPAPAGEPSAGEPPDFETQMRTALSRLAAALETAGSGPADVLKATVYLADPADMAAMNRLYREFFAAAGAPLPARSLVPGLDFGNGIAVEIDVIARLACEAPAP